MELPVTDGVALLLYAMEKENEEKLFQRWIGMAQYEMSFDDFKDKLKPAIFKPKEEVLDDVKNILKAMGENNGNI